MTDGKVVALWGDLTGERVPNDRAIAAAEELLEAVRAGEVVGFAVSKLHHDRLASYTVAGVVGGYGMVGAMHMALDDLTALVREMD